MKIFFDLMSVINEFNGLIFIVLAFLGKSYFDKKIKNLVDLETQRKSSFEIEMGKILATKATIEHFTQLELSKITYQIKYAKLHEKRIEVIENMYEKVISLNIDLQDLMSPFQYYSSTEKEVMENEQNQKRVKVINNYDSLYHFYNKKKLFFEFETRKKTDDLLSIVSTKLSEYLRVDRMKARGTEEKDLFEYYKNQSDASDYIFDEFPKLLEELERELQKTLGVE